MLKDEWRKEFKDYCLGLYFFQDPLVSSIP